MTQGGTEDPRGRLGIHKPPGTRAVKAWNRVLQVLAVEAPNRLSRAEAARRALLRTRRR